MRWAKQQARTWNLSFSAHIQAFFLSPCISRHVLFHISQRCPHASLIMHLLPKRKPSRDPPSYFSHRWHDGHCSKCRILGNVSLIILPPWDQVMNLITNPAVSKAQWLEDGEQNKGKRQLCFLSCNLERKNDGVRAMLELFACYQQIKCCKRHFPCLCN